MQCKPLIGVNVDHRGASGDRPAYSILCAGYCQGISAAGGIPVMLPPLEHERDLRCVVDRLDGFVLSGGPDLDPRRDGYMLHPSVRVMHPQREQSDRMLASVLIERRMPVLAIGCGMQLLNLTHGGNLFLHVPEDLPHALPHKDPMDPNHRHSLEVAQDSIMGLVYGDGEIRVNSCHHMAIDELADGFRVTARCPDGVIEAFESVDMDEWFVIGTQFHPESESASALDLRIFEEFVAGVTGDRVAEARLVA